jgi:uncharacterized protein (TIGR02466 family)
MSSQEDQGQLFGLFPTPLKRLERLLDDALVEQLVEHFAQRAQQRNHGSERLTHSQPVVPEEHPSLEQLNRLVLPHVSEFGALLLGERLEWLIKEMWVNVLETGGRQSMHNHANSFVSGVIYLSESHRSANTVFIKAPGGSDFVFSNANARARLGPYNADKWVSPNPRPGDVVLFPSYLLHEVPVNQGPRRVSLAFNAIPQRLDSWGYTLTLSR